MPVALRYIAALTVALLCWAPLAASAQCVSGTVTAEYQDSGPYAGKYKYTVDVVWTTTQGLSNVTLDCGFAACAAEACNQDWEFENPAGQGTGGDPGDCSFDLVGEFNCNGNPSIGINHPIIKWDAVGAEECEAGASGTATLCFYTSVVPADGNLPVFLVKNGQNICDGTLSGDCPLPCPVSSA